MLTLESGQSVTGEPARLPREAPARIGLLADVERVAHTALIEGEGVYRGRLIPVTHTGGLQVRATSLDLLAVLGSGLGGAWLNAGTAREPVAVLGSVAAQRLGIDRVFPDQRIWLGGQWFNVAGVLRTSPLEPDIDISALIGYPAAERYLGYAAVARGKRGGPAELGLRARRHGPRHRGAGTPRADGEPARPRRGRRQPAVRRAHRPRRRGRRVRQPLPRPRSRRADRRRGRRREHDGHLGAGAAVGDRPAPRARRHPGPGPRPVPRRRRSCSPSPGASSACSPGRWRRRSTRARRGGTS